MPGMFVSFPPVRMHRLRRMLDDRIRSVGLSPRGWTASCMTLVCLMVWPLTGWREFLSAGMAFGIPLAYAMLMARGGGRLHVTLEAPDAIVQGDEVRLRLTASYGARRRFGGGKRRFVIRLVVPIAGTRSFDDATGTSVPQPSSTSRTEEWFEIPPLADGASVTLDRSWTASSRTILRIGPACMRVGDPFGLVLRRRYMSDAITVRVWPRTVRCLLPASGSLRSPEGSPVNGTIDDGLDFLSLREYRPGDPVRGIHWPSSAKTGVPMVRQYEPWMRIATVMAVDADLNGYSGSDEFELAVAVYASLGEACLSVRRPLIVMDGTRTLRPVSVPAWLDHCSGIAPNGSDAGRGERPEASAFLTSTMGSGGEGVAYRFMVSGSATSPEWTGHHMRDEMSGTRQVSFRIRFGERPSVRTAAWGTVAVVGALADLPKVMGAII